MAYNDDFEIVFQTPPFENRLLAPGGTTLQKLELPQGGCLIDTSDKSSTIRRLAAEKRQLEHLVESQKETILKLQARLHLLEQTQSK